MYIYSSTFLSGALLHATVLKQVCSPFIKRILGMWHEATRQKGEADAQSAAEAPLVAPSIDKAQPTETQPPTAAENQGTFKSWFPGWGGWYGGQAPAGEKGNQQQEKMGASAAAGVNIVMTDEEALEKEKEIGRFEEYFIFSLPDGHGVIMSQCNNVGVETA